VDCPTKRSIDHWALATYDAKTHMLTYYDSAPNYSPKERDLMLKSIQRGFKTHKLAVWTIRDGKSAVQPNGYDCGLFLLQNAAAVLRIANVQNFTRMNVAKHLQKRHKPEDEIQFSLF
jgi:Ulp1 family protease